MEYRDNFQIDATMVANEFLDKYMPKANGDYVKVYLYLLKNRVSGIDIGTIADELELTEGDVRRALKYWESVGIMSIGADEPDAQAPDTVQQTEDAVPTVSDEASAALPDKKKDRSYTCLTGDADFSELLIIVQKYCSKILNEKETQSLAYLYEGLHLSCDVIDYLVEYCVSADHNDMRYIEKAGIDWAQNGIRTVDEARRHVSEFEKTRQKAARRSSQKAEKRGQERGTDYDTYVLEQVIRKLK